MASLQSQAQTGKTVIFQPFYGRSPISINDSVSTTDSIRINVLKFYLSHIEWLLDDSIVWAEKNSVHLLDFEEKERLALQLDTPRNTTYNRIRFCIGVDSQTNTSGIHGGDLDPMNGMYWTWQSGYINWKIEGKSPACKTRDHAFQFHAGGYMYPFSSLQTVSLPVNTGKDPIITINLQSFFKQLDLATQHTMMSPGKQAVILSAYFAGIFSIQQP